LEYSLVIQVTALLLAKLKTYRVAPVLDEAEVSSGHIHEEPHLDWIAL
jgi:hypothetical protein